MSPIELAREAELRGFFSFYIPEHTHIPTSRRTPPPTLCAHIAEFADGWMPIGGAGIKTALPDLRRAMDERGRDPSTLHVVPMGVLPDREKLAYYEPIGVTEAVLRLPCATRDEVLTVLDDFARYL